MIIVEIPADQQLPCRAPGCQEAVIAFPGQTKPFSCGKPSTTVIGWPGRNEDAYRMCDEHADHSVRNRSATNLGPYSSEMG